MQNFMVMNNISPLTKTTICMYASFWRRWTARPQARLPQTAWPHRPPNATCASRVSKKWWLIRKSSACQQASVTGSASNCTSRQRSFPSWTRTFSNASVTNPSCLQSNEMNMEKILTFPSTDLSELIPVILGTWAQASWCHQTAERHQQIRQF